MRRRVGGSQMDFPSALGQSQRNRGGNRCLSYAALAHGEDDLFVFRIQFVHKVAQPVQLCQIDFCLLLLKAILRQHGADVGNAGDWVSAKRYSVLCQPFQPLRHTGKGGLLLAVQLRGQRIVMLRQDAVDNEKLILNTQLPQFTGSAIGFLQRCCFRSPFTKSSVVLLPPARVSTAAL